MIERTKELVKEYKLERHPEGGWFAENYTSEKTDGQRAFSGSIYFMLDKGDISHFHQIDCEEIWYYHEGCGMKITVINGGEVKEYLLGKDISKGQSMMVVVPRDSIFAAENLEEDDYTFVSCMTTPKFTYDGFRLVGRQELKDVIDESTLIRLAYEDEKIKP